MQSATPAGSDDTPSEALVELWKRVVSDLNQSIGESACQRWFSKVDLVRIDDWTWLRSPNEIYTLWIEENYSSELDNALKQHLEDCPAVKFFMISPAESTSEKVKPKASRRRKSSKKDKPGKEPEKVTEKHHQHPDLTKWRRMGKTAGLSDKFSFDNFVVGDSNRLSHAAAVAVAEKPGRTYHPLFIHSASGLGKTHLLHAIGWEALLQRPKSKVLYISAEKFANEFIAAIQNNALVPFRKKYREDVDILLIDDVQFLAGKDGMQEEFFHTFNTLSDFHKQIVLASDRPATEIKHLEDRLVTRFQWGMSAEIFKPVIETRIAILRKKREDRNISVPDWAIEFIATHISSDIRAMEGALIRTATIGSLNGSPIDETSLRNLVREFDCEDDAHNINVHEIQDRIASHYDVVLRELIGKRRTAHLVRARHVAMYLARKLTDMSLTEIGNEFGGRDHGTIHHAVEKITRLLEEDHGLARKVESLRRDLLNGQNGSRRNRGSRNQYPSRNRSFRKPKNPDEIDQGDSGTNPGFREYPQESELD